MIFKRENHGVGRCLESAFADCFEHFFERDIGHHRVAVCDDGFIVRAAVPAVKFNAPTAGKQTLSVDFYRRLARQLVRKVGIVSIIMIPL